MSVSECFSLLILSPHVSARVVLFFFFCVRRMKTLSCCSVLDRVSFLVLVCISLSVCVCVCTYPPIGAQTSRFRLSVGPPPDERGTALSPCTRLHTQVL